MSYALPHILLLLSLLAFLAPQDSASFSKWHISTAVKRSIYDKFGEEGLKGGIPQEFGSETPWSTGYVFHGNADKVFHEFFGGNNPFGGKRF